ILLQSVDRDGARSGLDLALVRQIASKLTIPLVALGGAGELRHLAQGLRAGASAVASGSAFCFIGRLRAVLISYPSDEEFQLCLAGMETSPSKGPHPDAFPADREGNLP
ncbi:MAG TPA: HisA/HisF-related TIM barrel protein, partial [Pirellulaceae bacterium]